MEPVIPLNVNEEMVSDASMGALNLNGPPYHGAPSSDEMLHNLKYEDAVKMLQQLWEENHQLKANLQQANMAMKAACETMSIHKETERRKQKEMDERYAQVKAKIESLQQIISDRNSAIDGLQKQLEQASAGSSGSSGASDARIENLHRSVIQANQTAQQYKQRLDQVNQQLIMESTNKAQLVSQLEIMSKHNAQLKEELNSTQLKCNRLSQSSSEKQVNETQMVENLRSHVMSFQSLLKAEKDQNAMLQDQLKQLKVKHDQLLTDYHDLLVESGNKSGSKKEEMMAMKNDYDQRLDNLTAQIYAAEDTLAQRDSDIDALKQRVKGYDALQQRLIQQQQDIEMLKVQASIYKTDFEAERKSREELNDERLQLREKVSKLENELATKQMMEMQRRHGGGFGSARQLSEMGQAIGGIEDEMAGAVGGTAAADVHRPMVLVAQELQLSPAAGGTLPPARNQTLTPVAPPGRLWQNVALPVPISQAVPAAAPWTPQPDSQNLFPDADLTCPICGHVAPDIDSLQLHCNDCIQ